MGIMAITELIHYSSTNIERHENREREGIGSFDFSIFNACSLSSSYQQDLYRYSTFHNHTPMLPTHQQILSSTSIISVLISPLRMLSSSLLPPFLLPLNLLTLPFTKSLWRTNSFHLPLRTPLHSPLLNSFPHP